MIQPSALIEQVGETLWQQDSIRATGSKRREPWADISENARNKWCDLALAAIPVAQAPLIEALDLMVECFGEGYSNSDPEYTASVLLGARAALTAAKGK